MGVIWDRDKFRIAGGPPILWWLNALSGNDTGDANFSLEISPFQAPVLAQIQDIRLVRNHLEEGKQVFSFEANLFVAAGERMLIVKGDYNPAMGVGEVSLVER